MFEPKYSWLYDGHVKILLIISLQTFIDGHYCWKGQQRCLW